MKKECYNCGTPLNTEKMVDYHNFWLCNICNAPKIVSRSYEKFFMEPKKSNPFCDACEENECNLSFPMSCSMIKEYSANKAIVQELTVWSKAYPIQSFPEPDLQKAEIVLKANDITLDSISASIVRKVLKTVKNIIGIEGD